MIKLFKQFQNAGYETKQFIFSIVILILLLVVTLAYSYIRLSYDRSDQPTIKEDIQL